MKRIFFLFAWLLVSCQESNLIRKNETQIDLRIVAINDIEQVLHFLHPNLNALSPRRYFSFSDDAFPDTTSFVEDSLIIELLRQNPDLVDQLMVDVTNLLIERSQPDSLAYALSVFIQKHPQSSYGYYLQASLLNKQKQVDIAIQQLDQAIEYNNRITQYYLEKARLLEESQDYHKSLLVYGQAIHLLDQKWKIYWRKALLYEKLNQPESAIESFSKAIHLIEEYAANQKKILKQEENFGSLGKSNQIEIEQQIADAYTLRASYFAQNGQMLKACQDWKKASQFGDVSAMEFMKEFCK